jgi:Ca2+-binding RTX toxin-like protein
LTGADGADNFIFDQTPGTANADRITDFASGADKLHLDAGVMTALGASGNFAAGDARFFAGAGATSGHDADDRVVYNTSTGQLFYDADGNGAGVAQLIATLQPGAALAATDIVVDNGGATGGQFIQGTSGNDSLNGTPGNDTLDGGAGADTMNGGLGNDTYIVTAGDVLSDPGGVDTVLSGIDWTLADGFENLTLTGTANVSATGNNGVNVLTGNSGNNFFNPRGGDDTIQGGAGNDLVRLGGGGVPTYGNKAIDLGAGFDTLDFGGFGRSAIVVDLAAGTLFGGGEAGQGSARFTGIDQVIGDGFNDRLSGGAAAETLNGGGGNDTIDGRGGNDALTGGLGADAFVFDTTPGTGNAELVTDFVSATDKLSFDNAVFTALGADGNFVAGDARFAAGAGFTSGRDASDRLVYNTTLGQLFYDADGSGAGAAQLVATFQGHPAITPTDITVI